MPRSVQYRDKTGVTPAGIVRDDGQVGPSATLTVKEWIVNDGDVAWSNVLLRLVDKLGNSGVGVYKHGLDTVSVRPPRGGAAVQGGAGGTFGATGAWYFVVTRTNASGETQASLEVSFTVTDTTKKIDLSWLIPSGPADNGVKVYASQVAGTYGASALIASLGAGATTFSWDGTAPTTGSPPSANTTGGAAPNYGTPPATGTADLSLGSLPVGEMRAYWVEYTVSASPPDATYQVATRPVET